MRQPTRILGLLAVMAALLTVVIAIRWDRAEARAPEARIGASSAQISAPSGGPVLRLAGVLGDDGPRALHARQDVTLSVVPLCPAVVLEDGSTWVQATISSIVPLTAVAVFSDAGTPEFYDDDVPLALIEGDLDLDGVLEPGEFWIVGGAFFPGAGAVTDSIYASGTDEFGVVVQGFAACEPPPVDPPVTDPTPTEAIVVPTATTEAFDAASEDDFAAAQATAYITPTVIKSGDAPSVPAGSEISFTIEVANPGPDPLYSVEIEDRLPTNAGLDWRIEFNTDNGSCDIVFTDGVLFLLCNLGTLDPGEQFSVRFASPTTTDSCGFVTNSAFLLWELEEEGSPLEFIETSDVSIEVECPTLVVEKEARDDEISAGEDAIFDVTLTVNDDAFQVNLTDTLPDAGNWTMNPEDPDCDIVSNILGCFYGNPSAGEVFEFAVSRPTSVLDCGSTLINAVEAEEGTSFSLAALVQTDPGIDEATISVTCPDLRAEQNPDLIAVSAGEDVSFTVEVFNDGPGDAFDVELVNFLAAGIAWSVVSQDCEIVAGEDGPELLCNWAMIPAGESVSVTFTGETGPEDCSDFHFNNAEVFASNEPAAATDNNFANVQFSVGCPSIRVEKIPLPSDTISAGSTAEFRILVANDGPGDAFDVTLTDELPAGPNWFIASTEGLEEDDFACGIVPPDADSGQILTCTMENLPFGEGLIVFVDGETDPADCAAPLENTASAAASNEPLPSTFGTAADSASATITVLCPDLGLTKTASASDVSAGESVSYTIEATNDGPGVGFDIGIIDELPSNVAWEIASESSGCSIDQEILTCDVGNLAVDGIFSVTVEGTPGPEACGDISNSASLEATNDDTVTVEPVTITVLCPELRLVKTAASSEVTVGQLAAYTIEVFNDGDGDAFSVVLTDTMPASVIWSENPDTLCTIEGNELTCTIGTILTGESFAVTVEGTTGVANCAAPLTNSAGVEASNHASVGTESVMITVSCPDLAVEKTAAADAVSAGESVSFTITVTNNGDGAANDVTLSDTLPEGVDWVEDLDPPCTLTGQELSCEIGTLGPAGSDTDEFSVMVQGVTDADFCGTLANQATADASNAAPATSALVEIEVNCPALSVVKVAGGDVDAGETAEFTITVDNDGPGAAFVVEVRDELPAGIEWETASDDCGFDGNVLECNFGDIATDGSVSVTVSSVTGPGNCGNLTNTASVFAENHGEIESEAATITVNCAELLVTKDAADAEIGAGETARYTITVSNIGAGTATGVTVEDIVPDGIAWSDDSDDCSFDGPTLFCDFGNLEPTEQATVTISGVAGPEDCGEMSNTASAEATNADPAASDPSLITILCPGVAMSKVADAEAVAAGDEIGFTLTVTNPRVANALGVSLVDELPDDAGLSWAIDGGADADDCTIADGVLSCDFGTLPGGQSRVVHIASPTTEESCGTVENTATVEADNEPDDLRDNNTDTATVTVDCASIAVVKIATDGLGTIIETADVGDTITYLYFIANTGAVPLTDVTVLDDHFPVEGNLCPAGTTLAADDGVPGSGADEIVCAGEYLVGEIDITDADGLLLTNVATASGVSPHRDAVAATDEATITINEPKEPCEFPVTFTFIDDIDFVDDEGNVLYTFQEGWTFFFEPGEVNDEGGCTMPFTLAGTSEGEPVLASGTMSIGFALGGQASVRALVTDARLVAEVVEITAWAVPGVPAPEPEVGEVRATIIVSGPVLEVEADEARAVMVVEPELEVPFVQTEAYTISTPKTPNTGAGVTAPTNRGRGMLAGLSTLLPALAAVAYYRRRVYLQWQIATTSRLHAAGYGPCER